MQHLSLIQIALFLAAAAIAAPIAKWLKIGTVLGYLAAGVLIGPYGFGSVSTLYEAEAILHVSEFGVVLLLFLIGLELKPKRLWSMRNAIVGLGGTQVAVSGMLLALAAWVLGTGWSPALFIGLALALSSTAFALQVLEEKGELSARHGRQAFAILLFQDLAAIPLIALAPIFAVSSVAGMQSMSALGAVKAVGVIAGVVLIGRFVLEHVFRLVARTRLKEAMTASALLTVVGVVIVMEVAGLSASLGAFIAGALLADSSYRHQIEADIKPFEGLLLGLFFTAIGMALNIGLLVERPGAILALVTGLIVVKAVVLYGLGRWQGLDPGQARRLAFAICQGGEFAFVLFSAGLGAGVMEKSLAELLSVVVTLSMVATPLLLLADDRLKPNQPLAVPAFDTPPENAQHVIIAGFGRFGQIVARILRGKRIPFTALDVSPEQVDFVERFGSKIYYGDATREDILSSAQVHRATAFVLAVDDVEASLRIAEMVRRDHPELPILARARNRTHAHRLREIGVTVVLRETFLSALELSGELLRTLGTPEPEVRRMLSTFRSHDEARMNEELIDHRDMAKLQASARSDAETLERLFQQDDATVSATTTKPA